MIPVSLGVVITAYHCSSAFVTRILETLETCVDGGKEARVPLWQRQLKTEWQSRMIPYFLHASFCGLLDAVKYFIASGQKPNIRYVLAFTSYITSS